MAARLVLVVAYDGSGFRGFAAQPGARTVAGELASAMRKVVGHDVHLVCAGRTDAGVHARGQVIHCDIDPFTRGDADVPSEEYARRLARSLNSMLAPEVVVQEARFASGDFDARRSAASRRYRYLVFESAVADPLLAKVSWHVPGPLDLRAMAQAADCFLGEHDFRAFCRRPPGVGADEPIVRRVLDARWRVVSASECEHGGASPRLLGFFVEAESFCHQMVRSMVGMLVEVGRGRRTAAQVMWMLRGTRRDPAVAVAPPQGLCLVSVSYQGREGR